MAEGEEKKKPLEEQVAGLGLDMVEVLKFIQPIIAQNVAATLNEMKLPDLIASTIEEKVTAKTNAIGAEVKEALGQIQAVQEAQGQGQPQGGNTLQQTVLAALAQKLIGGGGDSTDSMDKFLDRMLKFQSIGATMYQNPLGQALTMLTSMMKTAYSMGLEPQQVVKGLEGLIEPPRPTAQP